MRRAGLICLVLASLCVVGTALARDAVRRDEAQTILGDPSIPTCPTSNCPPPPRPPVLSSQLIHGTTTKGAAQAEWLSTLGLMVKTGDPNGQKVTQYLGVMQQAGAGTAWTLNTDLVRNAGLGGPNAFGGFEGSGLPGPPGAIGSANGSIGYELDFTNWDADSRPGVGAFTVGQYVHAQGSFTSLAALYFDATMAASNDKAGWADGLLFNGDRVVSDNTIFDGTHAANSLTIAGKHVAGVNSTLANADLRTIVMKEGQSACFNQMTNCVTWKSGRLSYTNRRGESIFSIDENGNAFFKGHVFSK